MKGSKGRIGEVPGATAIRNGHPLAVARPQPIASAVALALLALSGVHPGSAHAAPSGEQLVGGAATVLRPNAQTTVIDQTSQRAALNWQSFGIAAGESVVFRQPSASAVALNRVTGSEASHIYGSLQANGQVFLVNPNGVTFARGASVDVGGIVASTLGITNNDFMAGRYVFSGGSAAGTIENHANIRAANGGYVAFLGNQVANTGTITANRGSVAFGAGDTMQLDFHGDGLLTLKVDTAAANAKLENSGVITADGGQVLLTARAKNALVSTAINMEGVITAKGLTERNGRIVLDGGRSGVTSVSGTLDASSASAGRKGGEIRVLGEYVGLFGNASLDASGMAGGGTVLVGGDFRGRNADIANAFRAYIGPDARVKADATQIGDGGKVIVWADDWTKFHGEISARGGAQGGNGGFVEVSGKRGLSFWGSVDTAAPHGRQGTLLLDPLNINIVAPGASVAGDNLEVTDNNTVLFADRPGDSLLISGGVIGGIAADVTLQATNDIFVDAGGAINKATGSLTMQAGNTITVNDTIALGGGILTLSANDPGGTQTGAGTVAINSAISAADIQLTTNGSSSALAMGADVSAPAGTVTLSAGAGGIAHNAGTLTAAVLNATTTGGPITQTAGNMVVSGASSFSSGAAAITLSNAVNNFTGAVSLSNTGANDVSIRDFNAIDLGTVSVGQNLAVTANGAITDTGVLTVPGMTTLTAGAANSITLDNANNFVGAVSIVSGNNVTLNDINALDLGTSTINGNLAVTATGNISDSGNLSVGVATTLTPGAGNSVILDQAGNNFGGAFSVTNGTNVTVFAANALSLGPVAITGDLAATASAGDITNTGGALSIGGNSTLTANAAGASIGVDNAGNSFTGTVAFAGAGGLANVSIVDASALDLQALTLTGNLNVTAAGITDSGNLVIGGATTLTAGAGNSITLDNANNFVGAVSIVSGRNVTLNDINALDLGTSTISGNLTVTATGNISDSGNLLVTGATTLTPGAGNSVILDQAGNNFTGAVSVTNGLNATLVDANALNLGPVTITGDLAATASAGDITNAGGALSIGGNSTLTANDVGTSIRVDNAGNNFTGTVAFAGAGGLANVSIVDASALDLQALTLTGNLNVTAAGITDSGNLVIGGATTLTAGAGNNVMLDNANDFTGAVSVVSGNNVTLNDINALDLGASTITGTLAITAAGNISDSGDLLVTGTTTLTPGAGNSVILDRAGNNFTGAVSVTNGLNATLVDANALNLGPVTITGDLAATVSAGDITNTGGALSIGGNSTLTANAVGASISVDNAGNNFTGTVAFAGAGGLANVSIVDASALDLQALTLTGNLNVTAAGITDSGNLVIGGATTLTAGAGNSITLDNANNFVGAVSIVSGRNVTLNDINALDLGASNVSGDLALTTAGAVTDSGNLAVTGATSLAAGATNSITLDAANDFGGAVSVASGNNVTLNDSNAIGLGAISAAGTATITAGSSIFQTGALSAATLTGSAGTTATFSQANAVGVLGAFTTVGGFSLVNGAGLTVSGGVTGGTGLTSVTTSGSLAVTTGSLSGTGVTLTASGAGSAISLNGAVNGNAGPVTLNAGALLSQTATGVISTSGTLTTTSIGGTALGAANTVAGFNATNTASGNIALTNTANPLTVTGINQSGGGNVSVTNTGNLTVAGDVNAGAGAITLTAAGAGSLLTNNANIASATSVELNADRMALGGNIATTAGGVGKVPLTLLQPVTAGTAISIGGADAAGTLGLTQAELNTVRATTLRVGNTDAGAITLDSNVVLSAFDNLHLRTGSTITGITSSLGVSGLLLEAASANISNPSNDIITLAGRTSGAGSPFTYPGDGSGVIIGTIAGVSGITTNNGNVSVTTTGAIAVNAPIAAGTATVALQGSSITSNGTTGSVTASTLNTVSTTGSTLLNALGNDVTTYSGQANTAGSIITFVDTNGFSVAGITAAGSEARLLASAGAITQTAGTIVAGQLSVAARDTSSFALAGNDIGTLSASLTGAGQALVYRDSNAFTAGLTALAPAGANSVQTNAGNVTLTSDAGTLTLATPIAAAGATVTLNATAGAIMQDAGAGITATMLTGTAGTSASLDRNNTLTNLGAFTTNGAFTLNDAGGLSVIAPVTTQNGGPATLTTSGTLALTTGSISGAGVALATTAGGDITLNGAVNGNAGTVALNSAGLISQTSTGLIGTTGALTGSAATSAILDQANTVGGLGPFTTGGNFTLNDTAGGLTLFGAVNAGSAAVSVTTAGGPLTLQSNSVSGIAGVTLQGVGVTSAAGSMISTAAAANSGTPSGAVRVTATGAGAVALGGDINASGAQSSGAAGGAGGNVTLTTANAPISAAVVNAGGGDGTGGNASGGDAGTILFNVGGANTLTLNGNVMSRGGDASGTGNAGSGRSVTFGVPTFIGGDATVATRRGTGAGAATAGDVTFAGTLQSTNARNLSVLTGGATTFAGAVGGGGNPLGSLSTDAPGSTAINGGLVTTVGVQSYLDTVTLGSANTLLGSAGGIAFGGTLDGASNLTVTAAGATTFGGTVGGVAALTSLTTNGGGTTAVNGAGVRTTSAQMYTDAVTLGAADSLFTSTGNQPISFASTVNGASNLTVTSAGLTTFGGAVGDVTPLTSLTTNGGGTTALNGGMVATAANQSYGDAVTLGANGTLTSSGASLLFAASIDADAAASNRTLTANAPAGSVTLTGNIGANQALADLDVTASSIVFNAGGAQSVNVSAQGGNTATFAGPVTLAQNLAFNTTGAGVNNVAFASALNADAFANNRTLNVTTGTGSATFGGGVGTGQELGAFTVSGNQLVMSGDVRVNGGGAVDFTNLANMSFTPGARIDTDRAGGVTAAGGILFGATTRANPTVANATWTLDANADGGGAAGNVRAGTVGNMTGLNVLNVIGDRVTFAGPVNAVQAFVTANKVETIGDGRVFATRSFDGTAETQAALSLRALSGEGAFGERNAPIQIAAPGLFFVSPNGSNALSPVFLAGDPNLRPVYQFAEDPSGRLVFYNGAAPDSPANRSAQSAITQQLRQLLDEINQAGFSKENIRRQLLLGMFLETGLSRPGIDDFVGEGVTAPPSCNGVMNPGGKIDCP